MHVLNVPHSYINNNKINLLIYKLVVSQSNIAQLIVFDICYYKRVQHDLILLLFVFLLNFQLKVSKL